MDALLPKAHTLDDFICHYLHEMPQPYAFLNAIIVPRPIALVTSLSEHGVINAAPFSYFNALCKDPPLISLSIEQRLGQKKDTARNIHFLKEFVINICSAGMEEAINLAGADFPPHVSEIEATQLELIPSHKVSVPRIANTMIQLECRLRSALELEAGKIDFIIGEIVSVHLHKAIFNEKGHVDVLKLDPLARLSGTSYARIKDILAE